MMFRMPMISCHGMSTRNRQSRDMPRLAEYSLSEARMQTGGHDQVDVATEHLLEPVAEADVPDEPGHLVEFHGSTSVSGRASPRATEPNKSSDRTPSER